MICNKLKEEDFKSRKEYLVAIAIEYIRNHTGFVGMDDEVYYDEARCDGYALASDLAIEFELDNLRDY